jgi:hypothetical protein
VKETGSPYNFGQRKEYEDIQQYCLLQAEYFSPAILRLEILRFLVSLRTKYNAMFWVTVLWRIVEGKKEIIH